MNDLRLGWVVLTIGSDLDQLAACLESIRRQRVGGPVLVVANGVDVDLPNWVRVLSLDDNVGIAAGRNRGLGALDDVDVVCFLDDDATLVHDDVSARVVEILAAEPGVAVVSLAVVDDDGRHQQRYVPRLGSRGADESGEVTTFAGGAHAIRRDAFLDAGGYPDEFFYAHEETDLAWRLLDRGHRIHYDARPAVRHPHVDPREMAPERHTMLARNRVWMARRNLPAPLHWVYPTAWLAVSLANLGRGPALRTYLRGWREGWRTPVQRMPIGWATVARLTRLGRPPIL